MIDSERDPDLDEPELLDELDASPVEEIDLNDCGDWEFVP